MGFGHRAIIVLLVGALAGCAAPPSTGAPPSDNPAPTSSGGLPAPVSSAIPATGGSVAVPNGASLAVPAGALATAANATITATRAPAGPTDAWPADSVGPTWSIDVGGVALAAPVTIQLPFDAAALPAGTDPSAILLAYRDDATGEWIPVPANVDTAAGRVTAQVDHLSMWGLFTINWDYWLPLIKRLASGNLGALLDGAVQLTSACPETGGAFTVDNAGANGMVRGCLDNFGGTSALLRIVNLRLFRLQLFSSVLGADNASLIASGEAKSVMVQTASVPQPIVIRADLDPLGLGYDITDILLRLLPGSELVKESGVYAKVLDDILKAQATLWTSASFVDQIKAGKPLEAASSIVELVTGETYITTLTAALIAAGKRHGLPMLGTVTKEGMRRLLTVVNLLDLIATTVTWDAQYFITGTSQVRLTWLAAPGKPTNITVSNEETASGDFDVTVKWKAPTGQSISGYRVYLWSYIVGECAVPDPSCGQAPPCPTTASVAKSPPSKSSAGGFGPWYVKKVAGSATSATIGVPYGPAVQCGPWVVAYNDVGKSPPGTAP